MKKLENQVSIQFEEYLLMSMKILGRMVRMWIQLLVPFLYLNCVEGLKGVLIRPGTDISLEKSMIDPLENNVGEVVIQSMTLTRRNAAAEDKSVVDSNGRYVGKYSLDCSESLLMAPARLGKVLAVSPAILEKGKIICHWEIIGTGSCVPMITCSNMSIIDPTANEQDSCRDEYLELTDGSAGYQKYCGKIGPVKMTSGRSYRDIYVTLKLSYHVKNRIFACTVTCMKDEEDEDAKSLDENAQPEVNHHCKCGRKSTPELKRDTRKEGDAKRGEYPWIASLVAAGVRKPVCVGSIINDRFILTSAHCFRGDFASISSMEVLIHPHEVNVTKSVSKLYQKPMPIWTPEELKAKDDNDRSFRYTISRYFIHPLFVKQINDFDVALVKLDKPIDFKTIKTVAPICLPDSTLWDQTKEGAPAIVTGWGSKGLKDTGHDTSIITTLKKHYVEVFKNAECEEAFDWRVTHRMLCAGHRQGDNSNGSCMADSGAPLISEKSRGVWEQLGVLSYAEYCLFKSGPGLYTDLRQVAQWIRYVSSLEEAVWCSG